MKTIHYLFLATGLLLILFANSCKKQEYVDPRPDFTTGDTSLIGESSATITGRLIKLNGGAIQKSGHVWSSLNDVPDLTINEGFTVLGGFTTDSNSYTSALNNLRPNTTYFVRGYMERNDFTFYGDIVVFKTNKEKILEVVTGIDSLKTFNSTLLSGYIFDLGKSAVTAYGHVWSTTNTNPSTADAKTNFGNLTTVPKYFVSTVTGLLPATTYYYKAYGTNAEGTFYGAVKSFVTSTAPVPVVTTNTITGSANNITVTGTLTTSGVPAATQHGFVYSKTNTTPTVADAKTSQGVPGAVPFNFTNTLTGLDYSATYYVRAYATSTAGTFYGDVKSFTISAAPLPAVTTNTINGSGNTIAVNATVTSNGVPAATQHGFVYSKTNNTPTIADAKTSQGVPGAAPFNFMASLTGLDYNSTYYVRAYVTSSVGTYYGEVKSFTISAAPAPEVTTNTISGNINNISVSGTVTKNGIPPATQHGFVFSKTNTTPTIADAKTSQGVPGAAPFNFMTNLIGLDYGSTYYVRAYVTNTAGTFYGVVKFYTTDAAPVPAVTTNSITASSNNLSLFGTVTSNGVPIALQHGFVYSSTNSTPTLADAHTMQGVPGTAPYNFARTINGLSYNTNYYVRAYITSMAGTFYGATLSKFTGGPIPPSVSTNSLTLDRETFTAQGTILTQGSYPIVQHGFVYSVTNTLPTIFDTKINLGAAGAVPYNFQTNFPVLAYSTMHYVRAFATSAAGTVYGAVFTKNSGSAPPG